MAQALIRRFADSDTVARAAAEIWERTARQAAERGDPFHVVLSGGSTPKRLYETLAGAPWAESLPWARTRIAFGDERCVPPDHELSNYRMARNALLDAVDIPSENILRMRGEDDPEFAARDYEERLREWFPGLRRPAFDLLLLGMGDDGHTASLFPGTTALGERHRWVVANHVPQKDDWRLTLTFRAINAAAHVLFLITGKTKADVFHNAFEQRSDGPAYPVEWVQPEAGRLEVLTDLPAREESVAH